VIKKKRKTSSKTKGYIKIFSFNIIFTILVEFWWLISIHKKTRIIKTLSYNIDHIYHNQEVFSCAYVFETGSQNKLFMYLW
jgi:hypothetical protein